MMLDTSRLREAQQRRDDEGFTLIELLVVIVILAILAAIVVFAVGGITNKGQTSACDTDLKTIQTAEEAYYGSQSDGPVYGEGVDLHTHGYLTIDPNDPANGALHTVTTVPGGKGYVVVGTNKNSCTGTYNSPIQP
jgi:general secretion pathway protein G